MSKHSCHTGRLNRCRYKAHAVYGYGLGYGNPNYYKYQDPLVLRILQQNSQADISCSSRPFTSSCMLHRPKYRAGSIQAVSIQASIQGPQYRAVTIQAPLDRRPPAAPDGQTSPSPARLLLQDVNADVLWSLSQQQPLDRRPPATLMGTPPPPLQ